MAPSPALSRWGRFHRSSRRVSRRLGTAGYLSMTVPLTVVLLLRLLGAYDGAVRDAMGFVGPLMMLALGPALLCFAWRSERPRWVHGALRLVEGVPASAEKNRKGRKGRKERTEVLTS